MANLSTYININANNVTATNLSATGNVSSSSELSTTGNVSGNYILGNGSQLTGLPATYSDSNVTSLLSNLGSNAISGTGNITTTGNISADYVVLSGGLVSSGASPAPSISGFSTISAIGNITGNYFIGNGSQLTGIASSYGNSDVATFLADYGSNTISTTGNISAGNVSLDGNLTVNGSPIYGVPASFAKYTRTTTQTGIVANTVIVCNVQENISGSDISVNTSTGNVTLTAGRTYRVRGTAGSLVSSGSPAGGAWRWYNATTSSYVGEIGTSISPAASNYNTGAIDTAEVVITPGVTTVLQLQMVAVSNMNTIGGAASIEGGYPWIDIEVIGGQAPITAFSTTGNVTGNYFIGNGSQLTGVASSLSGNLAGNLEGNGFGANALSFVTTSGNVTFTANTSALAFNTGAYISGNANSLGRDGSLVLQPAATGTFQGVVVGGSGRLLAPNGSVHQIFNASDVTFQVPIKSTIGTASTSTTTGALIIPGGAGIGGNIYVAGNATTGNNAVVAGVTNTLLPNSTASFSANVNSYTQITYQNKSNGADATADLVITADNGNDTVNYSDFGIINSGYDNATPTNSLGNIVFAADTYLYAQGNTGNASQSGGNLAIGTTVPGKSVKIFAGGVTNSSIIANISNTGVSVTGNVTASNFIGNISITGNVTGTSPNVSLVAGSYTYIFDNTGVATFPAVGGSEGGEINFGAPTANTTLIGPVKLDVYQDRIRFFDGSTKGVYIDLSQAGASVSTLLNNRVSGLVNAGTYVTMDLIKATVTTTGNRGLSLATTTGSFAYNIGGTFGVSNTSGGASLGGQTLTTTATTSIFNWGFVATGDISTYILTDTTNSRCYRITLMIGASFNNNAITIERLI